jgi:V/A-type H+-transporting ATPase subunit C
VYDQKRELFTLDATMDQRYFTDLHTRINAVRTGDRPLLHRVVGTMLDTVNLVWLLRFRFAYNQSPAEAYYVLNPGGYYLDSVRLRELAQLASRQEVLERLPQRLATLLEGAQSIAEVERKMEDMLRRIAEHVLWRTNFNLGRAFAFLILREKYLLRLHAVVKGRRLRLAPDLIRYAVGLAGGAPAPGPVEAT